MVFKADKIIKSPKTVLFDWLQYINQHSEEYESRFLLKGTSTYGQEKPCVKIINLINNGKVSVSKETGTHLHIFWDFFVCLFVLSYK